VFALLLKRKFLASTAFITNDTELIVLEREQRIRLKNRADFSCSSLFLPYPYITDVTMEGDIDNGTLSTIKLKVKNKIFSFLCGENNIQIEQLFQELTR
jgi:hypothetical protein